MGWHHVGTIAKKEIRSLGTEKTIVFAILLQIFIAMFSSFLLVGLAAMYDPDALAEYSTTRDPIAYTGTASPLLNQLKEEGDFRVYEMDFSTAIAALEERKISAVVWVPDTAPDAEQPIKITLYTIQNDIRSSVVNTKLKDVFLAYEADLREVRGDRLTAPPVDLGLPNEAPRTNFFEFVYGLLIPLLIFMPAIISAALIIDFITEEFQHNTIETLISTPASFSDMVWGKVLACFVIVPVQSGAWLILLMANGIAIQGTMPILLHVSAGALGMILLSAFCALHYRERTNAQFIFSTALVVVIMAALALPGNPANLIVRLSVGAAGPAHWLVLGGMAVLLIMAIAVLDRYARKVGRDYTGGR
ncbi:sodium ABC transporter permease [Methanomicrobiaceae archaeon CYW5]|uniref:ABC transporter permease n=1 Tax=Methanovulcanius yangii TaxID=1789227 RepID=UPI0029CA63B6|nr:ABC transporter permease [Methanovulcanius yangii]MBT8508204.1 sodium ABC transporter permease [Methanovulcanius yangii]